VNVQQKAVYGDVMNWQNITKWCHEFSEGRTDVHDDQRSGRPSLISDNLLQKTEGEIRANQCGADQRVASHHSRSV
jgi:transposase